MVEFKFNIDLATVGKILVIILAIIGVLALAIVASGTVLTHIAQPITPDPTQVPTPIPTPTPVPTQTITFIPISTTVSNGQYQVFTTTGLTLVCSDYYVWNGIEPQYLYSATETNGIITEVHLISIPNNDQHITYYGNDYPYFYEYGGRYYQYDGRRVDEVSWKAAMGQRVIRQKPPARIVLQDPIRTTMVGIE